VTDECRPRPLLTWQLTALRVTPTKIRTNIIFLETSIIDLHYATDSACLSSFQFYRQAPKEYFISARVTFRPLKVTQDHDFGTNRKRIYDFILVRNSNFGTILHHFGDIRGFLCSWPHPYSASILGVFPLHQMAHVGAPRSEDPKLFGREIIFDEFQPMWSRYLNVTDRQTDGQTDGRTTYDGNTVHCTKVHRAVKYFKNSTMLSYWKYISKINTLKVVHGACHVL